MSPAQVLAFPPREPSVAIPLDEAVVCVNCESIRNNADRPCPRCTSEHSIALSRILAPHD